MRSYNSDNESIYGGVSQKVYFFDIHIFWKDLGSFSMDQKGLSAGGKRP
jgi:hypothetical protein